MESGFKDVIGSNQNDARQLLHDWLGTTDVPWLMSFDSADRDDQYDLLRDYISTSNERGSVLMTSRDRGIANYFDGIQVTALDEEVR